MILYYALFCNSIQERLRAPHPLPHLFHLSALPPTGNQAFNEVNGGEGGGGKFLKKLWVIKWWVIRLTAHLN